MRHALRRTAVVTVAAALAGLAAVGAARADDDNGGRGDQDVVRFSTFNASLNRGSAGQLISDLSTPNNTQAKVIAEIVQRNRPDVLLINEFDFDPMNQALNLFQTNYLSVGQNGAQPIVYPHRYTAPSNTGIPSGKDLDNNGSVGGPNDAFGFGFFPGQFGMAVYSRYPIRAKDVRTFQNFLWKDMPGALLPDNPATPAANDWYSADELAIFRLSSKSHWDIPIHIKGETVHFLASHPTPPVFDDPPQFPAGVDFNGRRNFDEIRFFADYISGGTRAAYIYDDLGGRGGLGEGELFVIAGDQNSDPFDGDSIPGSAQLLLEHPLVNASNPPSSLGGPQQAALQGQQNTTHDGNPAFDTADFADAFTGPAAGPGNLRVDYVLPRRNMGISDSAVFWPRTTDPFFNLVGVFPFPSSDHKLVWVDISLDDDD
jgi:Endonuclease/Exonuclease/phosphatase family